MSFHISSCIKHRNYKIRIVCTFRTWWKTIQYESILSQISKNVNYRSKDIRSLVDESPIDQSIAMLTNSSRSTTLTQNDIWSSSILFLRSQDAYQHTRYLGQKRLLSFDRRITSAPRFFHDLQYDAVTHEDLHNESSFVIWNDKYWK